MADYRFVEKLLRSTGPYLIKTCREVTKLANTIEGELLASDGAYAVVVSRFNSLVTDRLLEGALDTLRRHGTPDDRVTIVRVPGAFEIPVVADRLAKSGQFVAVICLGAVIQGQTTHHEYINQQLAAGLMQTSHETGLPVSFGVLTCQSMEQAMDRAGGKAGNKGVEATLAAIETVNVLRKLDQI
ncbi:6,7-dimethyl-8-ribityllumazine synthase [Thalassoroseus pseudoceratinae]|uniref:6,7-dimethyl-8-ribityllumazine synthase n=1 Tax=Thalassoroseus pseudoceratinae TaxID=2713176 RepID=UPI00141EDDC3|nr:6,7-dimethyl-8-ribityllumazine synthase [Thalassoroseus pseudoceratinae]